MAPVIPLRRGFTAILAKRTIHFLLLFVLSAVAGTARADAVLDQAKQLLAAKQPQAAYALLEPLEKERAGEVEYDYVLGIAAIDSGNVTRGVFALERVLALQPNYAQARAEIARAYFLLGERRTAKQEFESVQRLGVPEEASQTIQRFLSAIEDAGAGDKPSWTGFLELAYGYDSNVNAGPGGGVVAVPALGGLITRLNPLGVEQSDDFFALSGGANLSYPLRPQLAVVGSVLASWKLNTQATSFDTSNLGGNLGLAYRRGRDSVTVGLQADSFDLDYNKYRDAYGGILQWTRTIDAFNSVSAYVQKTRLDYAGQQSIRDADRYVAGGAVGHGFSGPWEPIGYLSGYVGKEDERSAGVPWLGQDFWGLRIGGQVALSPQMLGFAAASVERRDYGGTDPFFLVTRRDIQTDLRLGAVVTPWQDNKWQVVPSVNYTNNDSNVEINAYDRWLVQIAIRRAFP